MRLQLALNVHDLEAAIRYYARLFNVQPHKRRPGYANFVVEQPPLKLVLFENDRPERLNHLGVEVLAEAELDTHRRRLTGAGLAERLEDGVTCCHATQDKVWSTAPDGERWEWYRVVRDDPPPLRQACCA